MTTDPKQTAQDSKDRAPTREQLEADVSIPASFDEVMQAVTDGYGSRRSGHHSA